MGQLKRPELEPGPLRDLFDALFDLRARAGNPGVRLLETPVKLGKTAIYNLYTSKVLPDRLRLLDIVGVLAKRAGEDIDATRSRFDTLWDQARHTPDPPSGTAQTQVNHLERLSREEIRLRAEIEDLTNEVRTARLYLTHYLSEPVNDIGAQRVAFRSAPLVPETPPTETPPTDPSQSYVFLTKNRVENLAKGSGDFPTDAEINTLADTLGLPTEIKQGLHELAKHGTVAENSRRQKREQLREAKLKRQRAR